MEARVSPRVKALLEQAANLRGCTLTEFVVASAQAAAEDAIRRHQVLELSARDTEAFYAAIEAPPTLDAKMRDAIRRHRETTRVVH
ncbi:MAG: DUF1778 domain-containing protein [Chloroflexota bacterium]